MKNLNVEHFLNIYTVRKEMQELGITDPSKKIKEFTNKIVEQLSKMPLDEEIILDNNSFYDSKMNLIIEIPMDRGMNFFKTTMPDTREADYYLGCLDSAVFLDFNVSDENLVYLIRISFDGYGCCNFEDKSKPLSIEDSKIFIQFINQDEFFQNIIGSLVKKAIRINKENIWIDALNEYELLDL
ncbi:hypothetical protein [Flavobacterium cheniae]|nr:hypothetical protein [Flavobacterium cheniae]